MTRSAPLAAVCAALATCLPASAWDWRAAPQPAHDPFLAAERFAQLPTDDPGVVPTSGYIVSDQTPPAAYGAPYPLSDPAELSPEVVPMAHLYGGPPGYATPSGGWGWEILPDGLIYRSYLAGPRESRLALHTFHNESTSDRSVWMWDATLGGRKGLLRYGNGDPTNPVGFQVDLEGAAVVRLNLDEERDVDASDFRFGVPLSYTAGDGVSYKFGYYHVSSHLGDELIARTGVNSRINYVRDAIIFGVSQQVTPCWRVYGETAFAFFTAGGAEPWEFQFGAEYSRPGATGPWGTPFFATNAHLREELDFGGDWTLQTGWLWRGATGSMLRLGLHYMNGKSTQYQFFRQNEEQVGLGLWFDF